MVAIFAEEGNGWNRLVQLYREAWFGRIVLAKIGS
jgi:hypothetical protein